MTARRATGLLCGLIIICAALTGTLKQYALVWWAGCVIAAVGAAVVVATSHDSARRFTPARRFIASGFVVLMAVVGFVAGATGVLRF